ncbi:protein MLP1 homolog [Lycium barbarum]|uniref:protein MLP1 homolog n=1 Tax=Lycium barbarum TaxID=112863 RepID=UPI00293F03DF|nr:protein MLP1 homolog [Lycium barbarum]
MAEKRAQICDDLETELQETVDANDTLKAELESHIQMQSVLEEAWDVLVAKLAQVEADLEETLRSVKATEAHTTIAAEYEKWKSRRITLKHAGTYNAYLRARWIQRRSQQRTRRPEKAIAVESGQTTEPVPETEVPTVVGPLPDYETVAPSEIPAFAEAAEAPQSSPTPASRPDAFDEMFADTPPATGEAASFGHLPIPRATRAGQLDAQSRETEKYVHLLRVKEDELSQAVTPSNLRPELDATKAENRQLKGELAKMVEYNRRLEADKIGLSRDNTHLSSRVGELETTVTQLREELDFVKSDTTSMAKRHRLLESENAWYKERMRVLEEKAGKRAQICDDLETELQETVDANDTLKAELESHIQMQSVLEEARDVLAYLRARWIQRRSQQRTRRPEKAIAVESGQRTEPVPETEVPTVVGPLPDYETAAPSEIPAFAEAAEAPQSSPIPASRPDAFDEMFADTPPATGEAGSFRHLPIPRATRAASRTTESGARDSMDELSQAVTPSNLRPELDATKAENRQLKGELAKMVEYNRRLQADKIGLSRDNTHLSSRVGELETTVTQLREELDSVKSNTTSMAKRHRLLESENACYKERMRVLEEKAGMRAQICDDLETKLQETVDANDTLKAELESHIQMQSVLEEARDVLRTRRPEKAIAAESGQRTESVLETEVPTDVGPLPDYETAAPSEIPAFAEAAEAPQSSPTPASRPDAFDEMFADTPPATGEAAKRMRVLEEMAEKRAQICDDLESELQETVDANDTLKAELESHIQMQSVLEEARDVLVAKLAQVEVDLEEALRSVEATEAHTTIAAECRFFRINPLQLTRRPEKAIAVESGQRTEPVPEIEVPTDVGPLPDYETAAPSEIPAFAEAAEAPQSSPTPASRPDAFDEMFADTPPVTDEAASFRHLPIPRATRAASRTTKSGARDGLWTRRPEKAIAVESGQRTEPVPETEVPTDVGPLPDYETVAPSEIPAFAEAAEAPQSSPTPASRPDAFDEMFADTPPATGEAARGAGLCQVRHYEHGQEASAARI